MRNNKSITDAYVGMRIKIRLPAVYCRVKTDSSYHWMKGYVKEVYNNEAIVVSIYSKKCGRINRMMCFKKNGKYNKIIKQL